jgi:hypothetical protein
LICRIAPTLGRLAGQTEQFTADAILQREVAAEAEERFDVLARLVPHDHRAEPTGLFHSLERIFNPLA